MALVNPELVGALMVMASQLSGLPPLALARTPVVAQVPAATLARLVCPEAPAACATLVAHADGPARRIWLSDSLDLEEATGRSFLLHELVHALESAGPEDLAGGPATGPGGAAPGAGALEAASPPALPGPPGCEAVLRSERRAFQVQNAYLRQMKRRERFGDQLAHMVCDPSAPQRPGLARLMPNPYSPNGAALLERFMEELLAEELPGPGR